MHSIRSHSPRTVFGSALITVALIAGLASCGGETKAAETTLEATTTTKKKPAPTTTTEPEPSTTTTEPATTTTEPATTTTVPAPPVYPLTGVENPDPAIMARPALVVKIDNAPGARPQTGFNSADMVFEEIVNDNLTRFAMVFHSGGSDPVGPIRSGRIQDISLFTSLDHPLFSWSGGNATVTREIDSSELINIGPSHAKVYYRARGRKAPHNLYSNTEALFAQTPLYSPPAKKQFSYRSAGSAPAGIPSPGVEIKLDSIDARWEWDAAEGLYRRWMEGRVHEDAASGQITTNNVVVLQMDYLPGISGSPDAQTIGEGEVFVFTGGNYIHGTWSRNEIHEPFKLTADDGTEIQLQPGRTFIELPRIGFTMPLPAA